jgi:hypothetical protein
MVDFEETKMSDNMKGNHLEDILKLYSSTLECVKPAVVDIVYKGVWPQTPIRGWGGNGQTADYHPTPIGHYKYLENLYPNLVTEKMKLYAEKYETLIRGISSLDETQKFWSVNNVRRL